MTGEGVLRALPVVDELVTEEGAVVLVRTSLSHKVVRLSVLGQLIREIAADGITPTRLVAELSRRLGPPPSGEDVAELVAAATADLERDGLVALQPDDRPVRP